MPVLILVFLLADLLAVTFPLIAFYLFRQWTLYRHSIEEDYAHSCLWGAIALLVLMLLGKFLVRMLVSKRRTGEEEPQLSEPKRNDLLQRADGTVINIEHYGRIDGQAIIFVHGLNANIKNWYYQRRYFEKNYRLIMIDLPGMGKSTRPVEKEISMLKLAADLQAVIEHTGAHNPILWGHSMGGMAILSLVAKKRVPNRPQIKGVILQHTTYTNPVRTMIFRKVMTAIQKPVLTPLCHLIIVFSPLIWVVRWMGYLNGSGHLIARFFTFAGTQTMQQLDYTTLLSTLTPPAVMAKGCLGMFRYDVSHELSQIDEPTLIIGASKDCLTQPDASVYMHERIPNSELVVLNPANHQGLIERHAEVNDAAQRFVKSLSNAFAVSK